MYDFVLSAVLILSVAFGSRIAISSPQPSPPKDQQKMNDMSELMTICISISKNAFLVHGVIELLLITTPVLVYYFPGSAILERTHAFLAAALLPHTGTDVIGIQPLQPMRVFGATLAISGSALRYMCYRALGRHFTFHVAVLPAHRLVTSGPYAYVRHPAYTGGYIWLAGATLWHAAPGAWLRASGVWRWPVAWVVLAPCALMVGTLLVIGVARVGKEDEMMKKEFGAQWEAWAQAVPYRLIPGVY